MGKELFKNIPSKVGDLVKDVRNGRIGLPDLQRPFVWKDNKVRELFDSMLKGYPIGYIMLWESPSDYESKKSTIGQNAKPEQLLRRIIEMSTEPGDIVLDSFLGSGTTAAVAHKLGRRYIGIEMGDHAYTHCKARIDAVIEGNDPLGITKTVNWQGGGGYRFFELAPSLINRDVFDEYVINEEYDADMLAAAVALHEGFNYRPDNSLFWKQSIGNENSYLFVTTRHLTSMYLDSIKDTMEEDEYLIIACRSFDAGLDKAYDKITIKKIPQMLLNRCEFGKTDYNLNIVHPPVYDDECLLYVKIPHMRLGLKAISARRSSERGPIETKLLLSILSKKEQKVISIPDSCLMLRNRTTLLKLSYMLICSRKVGM